MLHQYRVLGPKGEKPRARQASGRVYSVLEYILNVLPNSGGQTGFFVTELERLVGGKG